MEEKKQTNLTLGQYAKDYKSESAANVTELEVVNINYPMSERSGIDDSGREYTYLVIEFNHKDYRIPKSVVKQIQTLLSNMPSLENFKVTKSGEGLKTQYQVIPVMSKKLHY